MSKEVIQGKISPRGYLYGEIRAPAVSQDYENLHNHPQINGNTLIKNKTSSDLGLQDAMEEYTNLDILKLWNKF